MGSPMEMSTMMDMDPMKQKLNLLKIAMSGKWNEVVNIYRDDPGAHDAKITRAGDTALHIAVSDGQEDCVEQLVSLIFENEQSKEALKVQNKQGNTPLHFAASMGNLRMCKCIAEADSELVGIRNEDGETPLFLAALHGQKDTFLCLHRICGTVKGYSYCRKNDGETILHCAIAGEYFDLAYQIILHYDELVNSVNQQGISPLHLLASKPSAFRSGSNISGLRKIIYHCIFVDDLKEESQPKTSKDQSNKYPENYETCMNVVRLLWNVIRGETTKTDGNNVKTDARNGENTKKDGDAENPQGEYRGQQSRNGPPAHQLYPSNYDTCFEFGKLISKAILVILGFGDAAGVSKLQNKKEKHTWSVQIMNELLQRSSMYEYQYDGKIPQQQSLPSQDEPRPYIIDEAAGSVTFLEDHQFQEPSQKNVEDHQLPNTNQKDQEKEKNGKGKAKKTEQDKEETPILIAAKNGVTEMVEKILELFPVTIHDMNLKKKNIVLLAVENRQPNVYQLILDRKILKDSVFRKVDSDGNSALHLAAKLGEFTPWHIPGAALQMQWEIKWYEFVKSSMPPHFFVHNNKDGQTPKEIFKETHKKLVKKGGEWLTSTSNSCSVVAALIATVAFATSTSVPGGINEDIGAPTLEGKLPFKVFALSSLLALCFSVTALV